MAPIKRLDRIASDARSGCSVEHFQVIRAMGLLAQMHGIHRFDIALAKSISWRGSTLSKADIFCVFRRIKMHKGYVEDQRRGQAFKHLVLEVYLPGEQGDALIQNDPSLEEEANGQSKQFQKWQPLLRWTRRDYRADPVGGLDADLLLSALARQAQSKNQTQKRLWAYAG